MSNIFSDFVITSRYCRWDPELNRRENWQEVVSRYFSYMETRFPVVSKEPDFLRCKEMMLKKEVFGSMRALMTAGPALDGDDVASYNCSYVDVSRLEDLRNIMYVLMCGTGVGFSVEKENVIKLPKVPTEVIKSFSDVIYVEDSRAGWADAYHLFLSNLFAGKHVKVDVSLVRAAGTRLKTFGGRSSGPEPFMNLIMYTAGVVLGARGRHLRPIELHDMVCKIAEVVICGGVRRSALISLSDLSDQEMGHAKNGSWWENNKHRSLSNNSAVYTEKPPLNLFLKEWTNLYESHSGERGICNRESMAFIAKKAGRKTEGINFGTNPCSEIILRPSQFCNLSTVVIKPTDTQDTLLSKIELATILGTIQSALTKFSYFEERNDLIWKENCEEERLLGVSMTGIYDNPLTCGAGGPGELQSLLTILKAKTKEVNLKWANLLGINPSKSITCVKPEGTTSCVGGSSSGLHPRHSSYYIRRVRLSAGDPVGQLMKDHKVPWEPCSSFGSTTDIFSFPIEAPYGVTKDMINAIGHMELWAMYQIYFCDHKPSITVSYTDSDFIDVGAWIWKYWNIVSGISFLPQENTIYVQAPFEEITKEVYNTLLLDFPKSVNWDELSLYEKEDLTTDTKTLACSAGGCEV